MPFSQYPEFVKRFARLFGPRPPGWLPDPESRRLERYWDGQEWTARSRDRYSKVEFEPRTAYASRQTPFVLNHVPKGLVGGIIVFFVVSSVIFILAPLAIFAGAWAMMSGIGQWPDAASDVHTSAPDARPSESSTLAPAASDVAYPVFASDGLTAYLASEMITQNPSIDVTFYADGDDVSLIEDAWRAAVTQNPYIFVASYEIRRTGLRVVLNPGYVYADVAAEQRRATLSLAVLTAVVDSGAIDQASAADRVVAIHDYIAAHATYDYEAYEAGKAGDAPADSPLIQRSQEAYGNLVEGTSVCTGYAQAFRLMAQAAGVDSVIVTGEVQAGPTVGRHAWNLVQVDGTWLVVDVTWDDVEGEPASTYLLIAQDSAQLASRSADAGWMLDSHLRDYDA